MRMPRLLVNLVHLVTKKDKYLVIEDVKNFIDNDEGSPGTGLQILFDNCQPFKDTLSRDKMMLCHKFNAFKDLPCKRT